MTEINTKVASDSRLNNKTIIELAIDSDDQQEFEDRLHQLDGDVNLPVGDIDELVDFYGAGELADNLQFLDIFENEDGWASENEDVLLEYYQEDQEKGLFPEFAGREFKALSAAEQLKYIKAVIHDDESVLVASSGLVYRLVS